MSMLQFRHGELYFGLEWAAVALVGLGGSGG
jgi:hypothetical protein